MIPEPAQQEQFGKMFSHPLHFPEEFKSWITDYTSMMIPMIPFSHIFGARSNIARSGDFIATSETYSGGGTYGDLATVGPQILNIADGQYLIGYGCTSRGTMSPSINGATPSDDFAIDANESDPSGAMLIIQSFSNNNNNSVKLQYKENFSFANRWLFVMRLGAPA